MLTKIDASCPESDRSEHVESGSCSQQKDGSHFVPGVSPLPKQDSRGKHSHPYRETLAQTLAEFAHRDIRKLATQRSSQRNRQVWDRPIESPLRQRKTSNSHQKIGRAHV